MGLLANFLGQGTDRDHWYVRADLLDELSEIARKHWLREWRALPDVIEQPRLDLPASRRGAGPVELRVVQGVLTGEYIRRHGYIPAADHEDFVKFLLGRIVGDPTPAATEAHRRYTSQNIDSHAFADAWASDMAAALGAPDAASSIAASWEQFQLEQHYITALCFDDRDLMQELKARIEAA